ncbi:hypothetical protein DFP72DRAFT_862330 [Ephemerocybe angulata]|uniref:Uncharacterized protein n=1 Tax=Ephemerocybe angulata TaxID=980116 RepID=A0A8H6H8G6_9AGAR|nr:hypothetical protein DFP72DRAFT_862330 [Tulosesus angulatus]
MASRTWKHGVNLWLLNPQYLRNLHDSKRHEYIIQTPSMPVNENNKGKAAISDQDVRMADASNDNDGQPFQAPKGRQPSQAPRGRQASQAPKAIGKLPIGTSLHFHIFTVIGTPWGTTDVNALTRAAGEGISVKVERSSTPGLYTMPQSQPGAESSVAATFGENVRESNRRIGEANENARRYAPGTTSKVANPAPATTEDPGAALLKTFWDLRSIDAVRVSTGFIEAHLSDLYGMQNRLLSHHENLIRTRGLLSRLVDSIGRASYSKERTEELRARLEEIDNLVQRIYQRGTSDQNKPKAPEVKQTQAPEVPTASTRPNTDFKLAPEAFQAPGMGQKIGLPNIWPAQYLALPASGAWRLMLRAGQPQRGPRGQFGPSGKPAQWAGWVGMGGGYDWEGWVK